MILLETSEFILQEDGYKILEEGDRVVWPSVLSISDSIPIYSLITEVVWEVLNKSINGNMPEWVLSVGYKYISDPKSIVSNSLLIEILNQRIRNFYSLGIKRLHSLGNKKALIMNIPKRKS